MSIPWAALGGAVLGGGALTLAGTWSALVYQTRWQRQARKADAQRVVSLLVVRDLLGDVYDALDRVSRAQRKAFARTGKWEPASRDNPEKEELLRLMYRLRLRAIKVEDEKLVASHRRWKS